MSKKNQKVNILLVDDNPSNLTALEVVLHELGQNLIRAYSGEEALKQALKKEFAVILLDVYMPDMDGFETARILRSREKSRYIPIIFLTAFQKEEINIQQGYELGAIDYIFKPIIPDILRFKVKVFVDLFSKSTYAYALQNELKKRQQLERGYKKLADETQIILSSVGEGIYGLNKKGNVTFANPAAAKILGADLNELIGKSLSIFLDIHPLKNKEDWKKHPISQVFLGKIASLSGEAVFAQKNGLKIPVEYTASAIQDKRSKHHGAVVVFRNTTERKEAQELALKHQQQLEIAQAARLNSMKEMASALAHELNQPLAIIANYIKGCLRRLQQDTSQMDEILAIMKRAVNQCERAGAVIHRIKNLICRGKLYYETVNINTLINQVVSLMSDELQKAAIHITCQSSKKNIPIKVDKIQIQQVLLNLLRNSLDAMCDNDMQKKKLIVRTQIIDQDLLEVNVIDTGPGFSKDMAAKLFEAYFTTKEDGMGMGLSIARTIVEVHGGNLFADLNPAGGAWFRFVLPMRSY